VLLIRGASGNPVIDAIQEHLSFRELDREVAALAERALSLHPLPWQIEIHTPDFRQQLALQQSREWQSRRPYGPAQPGVRGPTGPVGQVPAEAQLIRLQPEEVEALLVRLREDAVLKARIERLRQRMAELQAFIVQAELRQRWTASRTP
jgi:hypothetical protein